MKALICLLIFLNSSLVAHAGSRVRTLRLKSNIVSRIKISHRGAVINFPTKPSKVVMGASGQFAIEYIGNDLAISPLRSNARAHVFVYLEGRRFNLDLVSNPSGHTLVQIRDSLENTIEVPYGRK